MTERWKDIDGYEGMYQVSDRGRVKSLNYRCTGSERICRQSITKKGYSVVPLIKDKHKKLHYVHRLVADAFIENENSKPTINHIDGNKENNCVENLEWATYSENSKHAQVIGLASMENGWRASVEKSRIAVAKTDSDGNVIKKYPSVFQASKDNHMAHTTIIGIAKGDKHPKGKYGWVIIPKNECEWERQEINNE